MTRLCVSRYCTLTYHRAAVIKAHVGTTLPPGHYRVRRISLQNTTLFSFSLTWSLIIFPALAGFLYLYSVMIAFCLFLSSWMKILQLKGKYRKPRQSNGRDRVKGTIMANCTFRRSEKKTKKQKKILYLNSTLSQNSWLKSPRYFSYDSWLLKIIIK